MTKSTDFFAKPFDEKTLVKLTIFSSYIKAWIPTFIKSNFSDIYIYDFFSGVGKDAKGTFGSPLRILQAVSEQEKNIIMAGCRLHIHFNDKFPEIFSQLKENCELELEKFSPRLRSMVSVTYSNYDFEELYPKVSHKLQNQQFKPSLFLVDPFGTFAVKRFLDQTLTLKYNDFLIFMPTSHIKRFYERPDFRENLDLPPLSFDNFETYQVHQAVVEQLAGYYQEKDEEFSLIPFTIQKNSNYYGIIFGAKHLRAFDKFLDIAWQLDPEEGNANYSISIERQRSKPIQGDLFTPPMPSKKEAFEVLLTKKVMQRKIRNNFQAFEFCIRQGHPPSHAREVLVKLKKTNKIHFVGRSPKILYIYYKNRNTTNSEKIEFIVL